MRIERRESSSSLSLPPEPAASPAAASRPAEVVDAFGASSLGVAPGSPRLRDALQPPRSRAVATTHAAADVPLSGAQGLLAALPPATKRFDAGVITIGSSTISVRHNGTTQHLDIDGVSPADAPPPPRYKIDRWGVVENTQTHRYAKSGRILAEGPGGVYLSFAPDKHCGGSRYEAFLRVEKFDDLTWHEKDSDAQQDRMSLGEAVRLQATEVTAAAFSPNAHQIAVGYFDGSIRVWGRRTQSATLLKPTDVDGWPSVRQLTMTDDGLLVVGTQHTVRVINPQTGIELAGFSNNHRYDVMGFCLDAEQSRLVLATGQRVYAGTDYLEVSLHPVDLNEVRSTEWGRPLERHTASAPQSSADAPQLTEDHIRSWEAWGPILGQDRAAFAKHLREFLKIPILFVDKADFDLRGLEALRDVPKVVIAATRGPINLSTIKKINELYLVGPRGTDHALDLSGVEYLGKEHTLLLAEAVDLPNENPLRWITRKCREFFGL